MTLDTFRRYLSTVPPSVDIHFSGFAEPWHAPDCTKMVRHTHEHGHQIAVFTTADGMESSDVEAMADLPFKRFVVHLPDQFAEMRLTVDPQYLQKIRYIAHIGIKNLEFLTLGVPHREVTKVLGWQPSTRRIHSRAANVAVHGRTLGTAFDDSEIADRNRGKTLVCRQDRMLSNVLLPNGDVQFCAMDYGLEHKVGNLNEQSYAEVVTSTAFRRIFEALNNCDSDILCRRCEYAIPGRYRETAS